jgi:hypothetical protein
MAVLGMIGLAGVYLRQVRQLGWLGLIGAVMFGFFFILQSAFNFAEAFIAPLIVAEPDWKPLPAESAITMNLSDGQTSTAPLLTD